MGRGGRGAIIEDGDEVERHGPRRGSTSCQPSLVSVSWPMQIPSESRALVTVGGVWGANSSSSSSSLLSAAEAHNTARGASVSPLPMPATMLFALSGSVKAISSPQPSLSPLAGATGAGNRARARGALVSSRPMATTVLRAATEPDPLHNAHPLHSPGQQGPAAAHLRRHRQEGRGRHESGQKQMLTQD